MGLPIKTGGLRSVTIGGYTFDWDPVGNSARDIPLIAGISGTTNKYCTTRTGASTSGYQVPSGKTLYVIAAVIIQTSSTTPGAYFAQTDNDQGFIASTAPTNPVYFGSSGIAPFLPVSASGNRAEIGGFIFPVAALKYFSVGGGGGATEAGTYHFYAKLIG